jgi:hypothetical protein
LNTENEAAVPIKQGAAVASNPAPVAAPSAAPPGAWGTHAEPAFDVERINPVPPSMVVAEAVARPEGIFLSRSRLTLVVVAGIVIVALAFIAGLLLGYYLHPSPQGSVPESPAPASGET